MTKEEALRDFLASLKTALNNAAVYFKDHPLFLKSAKDLKEKADALLVFLNPAKISISPDSLFIDGKNWEKSGLSKELASFFHFRKVESFQIKNGVSPEELIFFISKASLSPRDIFKDGGLEVILRKENISSILVQGLDYSQLLGSQGKECKDIWAYMFQEAVEKQSAQDISNLADNFGKVMEKFKVADLLEDEDLRKNIYNFLNYLKNEARDKFKLCSKEIAGLILRDKTFTFPINRDPDSFVGNKMGKSGSPDKTISKIDQLNKLRVFFKDLSGDELSDILWEEAASDKDFDALSFNLLSSLLDKNQHARAASSLADKIKTKKPLEVNLQAARRLKELFFAAKDQTQTYDIYRKNLESLFKNTFLEEAGSRGLNLESARASYHFLILNLLIGEKNKAKLSLLSERVKDELDSVIKNKDAEFLMHFLETCERRKKESGFTGIFEPVKNAALSSIENLIFQVGGSKEFEGFSNLLSRSFLGVENYLNKIFNENIINSRVLKMYFKFFPGQQDIFYNNLKIKSSDTEFLRNLIESVKEIDSDLSLEIFKNIFFFSHSLIKLEILKAMRELSARDENFLFYILKAENVFLRKEALGVLAREEEAKFKALKLLLDMPGSWGRKNKILEENINIVVEEGLVEPARDFLLVLSRRGFLWNKKLRKKANSALESLFGGGRPSHPLRKGYVWQKPLRIL